MNMGNLVERELACHAKILQVVMNYRLFIADYHTRYETVEALHWRAFGKIVSRPTGLGQEAVQTGNRIIN
jgi:hypothetical protein